MTPEELKVKLAAVDSGLRVDASKLQAMGAELESQSLRLTYAAGAIAEAAAYIEQQLQRPPCPEPALEIVRAKTDVVPTESQTIDFQGNTREYQGLWNTRFPLDTPAPNLWPSHLAADLIGKPSSDERFPVTVQGYGKTFAITNLRTKHRLHPQAPWHIWKMLADSDGLRVQGQHFDISDSWVDNVTDGYNPRRGGSGSYFTIRDCLATRVHDDCIENDETLSGEIHRCYFAGHTFYSSRGTANTNARVTINRCIVELLLQPFEGGSDGPSDYNSDPSAGYLHDDGLGCGTCFKLDFDNDSLTSGHSRSGRIDIRDSIFLVPRHSSSSIKAMRWPSTGSFSNVTLVWLGDGDWPTPLPPGVTLTRDLALFENAKDAWLKNHPQWIGKV